ncbi:MAG: LysM peptidoglycan-binding domain-containing protein [Anaerolineae bacterium]|nr:LysM peptidoglycan-binding domain-containing protein [Anaerolineae bacterium]NPV57995.1 LysM peptidoglycan-binding domain-containing protein [Anaerolineae bacterium]
MNFISRKALYIILVIAAGTGVIAGCVITFPENELAELPPEGETSQPPGLSNSPHPPAATIIPPKVTVPPTRQPGQPILTPTPDNQRMLPKLRDTEETYTVSAGDTLSIIAKGFGVTVAMLIEANGIADPNLLDVGQQLLIPAPVPNGSSPAYKIIPDSELVYGPMTVFFDPAAFIAEKGGYLSDYSEEVDEIQLSGGEIVTRVSREFSVNPKLLLAVLEYQSGWVSSKNPDPYFIDYPAGYPDSNRKGLWRQLTWAANQLNFGYYTWKANVLSAYFLPDGNIILPTTTLNAGTVGVQYFFSQLFDREKWESVTTSGGFNATYQQLFGYAFDQAIEPLVPSDLEQPIMQLPFEDKATWSFTGGPHGGWGDGSAWAALDFAPPGETAGCVPNNAWVTASAPGLVVRSNNGVVVIDLDFDGYEQTGWSLLYLHMASQDRIAAGSIVSPGDRIGHPSCEGGLSSGTHVHLARRYNGEWIEATGAIPFLLDGWFAEPANEEYDGYLVKDGYVIEAWDSRKPENQIHR